MVPWGCCKSSSRGLAMIAAGCGVLLQVTVATAGLASCRVGWSEWVGRRVRSKGSDCHSFAGHAFARHSLARQSLIKGARSAEQVEDGARDD